MDNCPVCHFAKSWHQKDMDGLIHSPIGGICGYWNYVAVDGTPVHHSKGSEKLFQDRMVLHFGTLDSTWNYLL